MLSNGVDPGQFKKETQHQTKLKAKNSFYQIAHEWHETKKTGWT